MIAPATMRLIDALITTRNARSPTASWAGTRIRGTTATAANGTRSRSLLRTARVGGVVVAGIRPRGRSKGQDEQAGRAERCERPGPGSTGQLRPAEIPDTDEGQAEQGRVPGPASVRGDSRARSSIGGGGEDAKDEERVNEKRQLRWVVDGACAEDGEQAGRHRRARDRCVEVDAQLGIRRLSRPRTAARYAPIVPTTTPARPRSAGTAERASPLSSRSRSSSTPNHAANATAVQPRAPAGRGRSSPGTRASRSRDSASPRA